MGARGVRWPAAGHRSAWMSEATARTMCCLRGRAPAVTHPRSQANDTEDSGLERTYRAAKVRIFGEGDDLSLPCTGAPMWHSGIDGRLPGLANCLRERILARPRKLSPGSQHRPPLNNVRAQRGQPPHPRAILFLVILRKRNQYSQTILVHQWLRLGEPVPKMYGLTMRRSVEVKAFLNSLHVKVNSNWLLQSHSVECSYA